MGKLASSLELMEASWEVLKKDKEILFIPVISGISVMVMLASFVIPVILAGNADLIQRLLKEDRDLTITISFIFYFLNYLIVVFFNSAIVACATIRMGGGDPTLLDGLNIASSRIFKIIMSRNASSPDSGKVQPARKGDFRSLGDGVEPHKLPGHPGPGE